jgi:hypothetical protein
VPAGRLARRYQAVATPAPATATNISANPMIQAVEATGSSAPDLSVTTELHVVRRQA